MQARVIIQPRPLDERLLVKGIFQTLNSYRHTSRSWEMTHWSTRVPSLAFLNACKSFILIDHLFLYVNFIFGLCDPVSALLSCHDPRADALNSDHVTSSCAPWSGFRLRHCLMLWLISTQHQGVTGREVRMTSHYSDEPRTEYSSCSVRRATNIRSPPFKKHQLQWRSVRCWILTENSYC
jgi:hypothetical protein